MDYLLHHAILLAQRSRLDDLSRGFRPRPIKTDDILIGLMVLSCIVVVVWGLSYLLTLQERRKGHTSPLGLFLSLCKAHRLPWPQRWLLWQVSRARRLRDPARLFLEPELLEAATLGPRLRIRAGQLKRLREQLFAGLGEGQDQENYTPPPQPDPQPAGTPPLPVPLDPTLDVAPLPTIPAGDGNVPMAESS